MSTLANIDNGAATRDNVAQHMPVFTDVEQQVVRVQRGRVLWTENQIANDLKFRYLSESDRLLTFSGSFKCQHMTALSLAHAGFIYIGDGTDEVMCLWCGLTLSGFPGPLDAYALHQATSYLKACDFITRFSVVNQGITAADDQFLCTPGMNLDINKCIQ